MIEVHGAVENGAHGHDYYRVKQSKGVWLLAVADGVTASDLPFEAAERVVECTAECFERDPRQEPHVLQRRLAGTLRQRQRLFGPDKSGSATLTVVTLTEERRRGEVTARFFACGDSPIYVASPGPLTEEYPETFLTVQVHGKPLQVVNAGRVYSYVDVASGVFRGRIATGTFRLKVGDICLIFTDGFPVHDYVLWDWRLRPGGLPRHEFLSDVRQVGVTEATEALFSRIRAANVLVDDATLIAAAVTKRGREAVSDRTAPATYGASAIEPGSEVKAGGRRRRGPRRRRRPQGEVGQAAASAEGTAGSPSSEGEKSNVLGMAEPSGESSETKNDIDMQANIHEAGKVREAFSQQRSNESCARTQEQGTVVGADTSAAGSPDSSSSG